MFKRVAKRERKREKEEDLGLDEETKQVLGLQDTDSDESLDSSSNSESDDSSDVDSGPGEEIYGEDANLTSQLYHKQKRPTQSLNSFSDGIHEESERSDVEDEGDDDEDEDGPPMSVMAATTDPIYDLPNSPRTLDLRACIICPGKVIKNPKMTKVHLESSAHRRRLQHYTAEVSRRVSSGDGLNTDDPRDILRDMSCTVNYRAQVSTSKRSQRRTQWKNKQAERRMAQGEKMAMDESKEPDHKKGDAGGTIKKKVKKVKNGGNRTGVSGILPMGGSSRDPKAAEGRHNESLISELMEPILDANQHARPKKRQKPGNRRHKESSRLVEPNLEDNPHARPKKRQKQWTAIDTYKDI